MRHPDPLIAMYQIILVADRYSGIYSGGEWIAVADIDPVRFELVCGEDGASGDDGGAQCFWMENGDANWIAVGKTPASALDALVAKWRAAE